MVHTSLSLLALPLGNLCAMKWQWTFSSAPACLSEQPEMGESTFFGQISS